MHPGDPKYGVWTKKKFFGRHSGLYGGPKVLYSDSEGIFENFPLSRPPLVGKANKFKWLAASKIQLI